MTDTGLAFLAVVAEMIWMARVLRLSQVEGS